MNYLRLSNYSKASKIAVAIAVAVLSMAGGIAYYGGQIAPVILSMLILSVVAYRVHVRRLMIKAAELERVNNIQISTVEALATAIDARDQIGSGHVRRTQIYAIGLAKVLGLDEDEVSALRTAALLHDVGKLAIPDHILSKPGKLTDAEFEKTKIHSAVGASIIEDINFQFPVVETVRSHHENWDGTGYPDGLKGTEIPVTARILSLADAYDTMRSERPYRPAVPREEARQELLAGAGMQFEPSLVHSFLKHLTAFEEEINAAGFAYPDTMLETNPAPSRFRYIDQIKDANKEVFTLFELSREFSAAAKVGETLSLFTRKIRDFIPFDTCAVYLMDATGKKAEAVHVVGDNADKLSLRRIRVGEGATGFALLKRKLVANVNPDLDFSVSSFEFGEEYLTMATVPLIAGNDLIGAVSLYSKQLSNYADEHLRLLETVSQIAANAIERSMDHDEATSHALTDTMTGLPNARSLRMQFDREVSRAERAGGSFQVLMLDLDGFKSVNDTFGHKAGDRMLLEVGQVILGQLREYDFLARYGGDEFVALVNNATTAEVADLCDRIEAAVADFKLEMEDGRIANVGVSPGAAACAGSSVTFDEMIVSADKAMYERKSLRHLMSNRIDSIPADNRPMSELIGEESHHLGNRSSSNISGNFIVELDESHVISSSGIH